MSNHNGVIVVPRDVQVVYENELIDLYKQGRTVSWIAETIGLSEDTVSRYLKRNGIKTRRGRPRA